MFGRKGRGQVTGENAREVLTLIIFLLSQVCVALIAKYNTGCPDVFEFQTRNG
jgi:hypothetical protein